MLGISRGSVYYLPRAVPAADLAWMRAIDALHLEYPFAGSRMLQGLLLAEGATWPERCSPFIMQRQNEINATRIAA